MPGENDVVRRERAVGVDRPMELVDAERRDECMGLSIVPNDIEWQATLCLVLRERIAKQPAVLEYLLDYAVVIECENVQTPGFGMSVLGPTDNRSEAYKHSSQVQQRFVVKSVIVVAVIFVNESVENLLPYLTICAIGQGSFDITSIKTPFVHGADGFLELGEIGKRFSVHSGAEEEVDGARTKRFAQANYQLIRDAELYIVIGLVVHLTSFLYLGNLLFEFLRLIE